MTKRISKQTRRSFVELSTIGLVGTFVAGCDPSSDPADESGTGSTGGSDDDSSSSDETKSAGSESDSNGETSGDSSSDGTSGSGSESGDSSSDTSSGSSSESGNSSSDTSSGSTESSGTGSSGTESGSTESGGTESSGTESSGTESSGTESSGTESGSTEDSGTTESSEDDGSDTDQVCEEIDPLTPGPFFQDLTERADGLLDLYEDEGVEFELVGRVLDRDCKPVANAWVGMWHASPAKKNEPDASSQKKSATYDHPRDKPDPEPKNEDKYYGRVKVDADGHYRFKSLRPGWYLNKPPGEDEEGYYRPSHLHIKVFVGTQDLLITQLFFDDDPELMNDGDNGQGHLFSARNVLKVDASGKATFDLIVDV